MMKNLSSPSRVEKKIPVAPSVWDQRLTMGVSEFLIAAGIGRTLFYKLVNEGELETCLIGRKRLVVIASWKRLIERNRAPAALDGGAL